MSLEVPLVHMIALHFPLSLPFSLKLW